MYPFAKDIFENKAKVPISLEGHTLSYEAGVAISAEHNVTHFHCFQGRSE